MQPIKQAGLCGRKRQLLLVATLGLAAILALCPETQAGNFFEDMFKKKNNNDDGNGNGKRPEQGDAQSRQATPDGADFPQASSDTDRITAELMRMNQEEKGGVVKRRRPNMSLLSIAAQEQEKLAQSIGSEDDEEEEEDSVEPEENDPRNVPQPEIYGKDPPIKKFDKTLPEYYEEDGQRPTSQPTPKFGSRIEALKRNREMNRHYINTAEKPADAKDRSMLKPTLVYSKDTHKQLKKTKQGIFSSSYLKRQVNKAVKGTKTGLVSMGQALGELPKKVNDGYETISAKLKLDNRGILLSMIEQVNVQIKHVRKEFSQFSIDWAYVMERALSYLGTENLDKLRWSNKDELDFRRDALHVLTFGYEMARLFTAWRENLLVAHEAYKLYLETVIEDLCDKRGPNRPKVEVDDFMKMQLEAVHSYLLLTSWLDIDSIILEPKMKLDYLMTVQDDVPKNYESEYFRHATLLQEIYEPTIEDFQTAKDLVLDNVATAALTPEKIEDINQFYDNFRDSLANHEVKDVDWEVPKQLSDFLEMLRPQLQYNLLVYNKKFLEMLKIEKQRAARAESEYVA